MTLAFTLGQPAKSAFQTDDAASLSLQNRVHRAIASHTEFSLDRIVTQDNRVKYSVAAGQSDAVARTGATDQTSAGKGEAGAEHLDEVFQLMRQLNEVGVTSRSLGCLTENGRSFRQALNDICVHIASVVGNRPMTYVELGPEPVKTTFIITALLELGVTLERYVAVDINPKSSAPMRSALQGILPDTPLEFVTGAFETFRLEEHAGGTAAPALITMLGFQEGNDDPFTVGEWLRNIARPGDLMLSESQLYTENRVDRIPGFYAHPAMQRFSRIAFEQAINRHLPTLNRFFLLPVPFRDGQIAQVAILGEEFADAINGRNLHVSNFCLKLTLEQYRHYRQHGGYFEITGETFTDDETLHFQLSRRI